MLVLYMNTYELILITVYFYRVLAPCAGNNAINKQLSDNSIHIDINLIKTPIFINTNKN